MIYFVVLIIKMELKKIKLIECKESSSKKYKYTCKFEVTHDDGKVTKRNTNFGAKGYSDYTIHNDTERRNRYIDRHWKDLKTDDPTRAGYLSMYILWNYKSYDKSLADYKKRLEEFNKTGKFPKKIKGHKPDASFGLVFLAPLAGVAGRAIVGGAVRKTVASRGMQLAKQEAFKQAMEAKQIAKQKALKLAEEQAEKAKQLAAKKLEEEKKKAEETKKAEEEAKKAENSKKPEETEKVADATVAASFGKIPKDVLNPELYKKIKKQLQSKIKNRRWGVYDSARLIRMYKDQGGKYSKNKKKFGTDRWFDEKWIDACAWLNGVTRPCGRSKPKEQKLRYCRPLVRVNSKTPKTVKELSRKEIARRCNEKRRNPNKIVT